MTTKTHKINEVIGDLTVNLKFYQSRLAELTSLLKKYGLGVKGLANEIRKAERQHREATEALDKVTKKAEKKLKLISKTIHEEPWEIK